MTRRIRIGIDTGGTFTHVVALDEDSGSSSRRRPPRRRGTRPTASHRRAQGPRPDGGDRRRMSGVTHGTTVATNQLLEGKVEALGFITTEGYEFLLEMARQAVPDGYGNTYSGSSRPGSFPPTSSSTVGGRIDFEGNEIRPFDEERAVRSARWFRSGHHDHRRLLPHSYAATVTSGDGRCAPREHPTRSCRSARRCCASTATTSVDDDPRRRRREAGRVALRRATSPNASPSSDRRRGQGAARRCRSTS